MLKQVILTEEFHPLENQSFDAIWLPAPHLFVISLKKTLEIAILQQILNFGFYFSWAGSGYMVLASFCDLIKYVASKSKPGSSLVVLLIKFHW